MKEYLTYVPDGLTHPYTTVLDFDAGFGHTKFNDIMGRWAANGIDVTNQATHNDYERIRNSTLVIALLAHGDQELRGAFLDDELGTYVVVVRNELTGYYSFAIRSV